MSTVELFNLTTAEFAVSNLALRRIKVSRISDLNDPFELLPINIRNKTLRAAARQTRDQIAATRGVICFSATWSNPVLWSHYADKHRGMALGFAVSRKLVMPVRYEDSLPKIAIERFMAESSESTDLGQMLLATKFSGWRYENESRVFVDLTKHRSDGGHYFCEFDDHLELRSVILGARCEVPIDQVRDLVSTYPSRVHVKQARIAFTKFAVVEGRQHRAGA